ncbi:hypothetical protein [Thermospira aquatica]|uniref:Uncharacterized protein n=1 Tax=Thermospira aquatica TaxID=2828656 RepID=A0AAX3BDT0_9SPIR|nr:hypothetical protein [Thermospira aquatica]URA10391.1 hypothetical protein KDW03_00890 [Thermospira aquatica]
MKKVLMLFFLLPYSMWALLVLSNEYLAIYHDESKAAFYIKTIEGDPRSPADNNAYLLYNKFPPTTIATIRMNNENIIFGSDQGNYEQRPKIMSNAIITLWAVKGVAIEQILSFAPNPVTGLSNHVRISYRLKNNTKQKFSVGLRLLLDVYLKESGVSSFGIPGKGWVSRETAFYQESIPDYWYAVSADNALKVRGSLKGLELTLPSQVIFASWNKLYDNLWDVPLNTSQNLKPSSQYSGAVALYYNPVTLGPGQSMLIHSLYGIHTEESFTTNNLLLSLVLPEEVKAPPVQVSADLTYTGAVPLDSLHFTLTLPKGFTLAEGDTNTIAYLKVLPGESRKAYWNLQRSGTIVGNFPVKVTVTALADGTTNTITGTKNFFINYREVSSLIVETNIPIPETSTNQRETNVPIVPTLSTPIPATNAIFLTNTIHITNHITNLTIQTYPPHVLQKIHEIQTISRLIEELTREYALWLSIYRNSDRISQESMGELERRIRYYEEQIRLLSQTNTFSSGSNK